MNRTQALAKLRPILGKHLAWREDGGALTGDEREAAGEASRMAQVAYEKAKKATDERRAAVLASDAEYQRLKAASVAAYEAQCKASHQASSYRLAVGISNSLFFEVKAQGDNWQEVVDKLTKK